MHLNVLSTDQERTISVLMQWLRKTDYALPCTALSILLVLIQVPVAEVVSERLLALTLLLLLVVIIVEHTY